jgi:transcriptional regulator with XRE-family HTH domain
MPPLTASVARATIVTPTGLAPRRPAPAPTMPAARSVPTTPRLSTSRATAAAPSTTYCQLSPSAAASGTAEPMIAPAAAGAAPLEPGETRTPPRSSVASSQNQKNNAANTRYPQYISDISAKRPRPHSPYAAEAARLLGAQIRLARRERHWSQDELAERIGITARTVYKIEHGDLSVGLGATFEAAALLGVPLFYAERPRLRSELDRVQTHSALLPRPTRSRPTDEVNDDF